MFQFKQVIAVCVLTSAFLVSEVSHAGTYYVATTGSNSNPGTSSQPWRTVAHAASKMVAGDTTYVKGGIYKEGLISFGNSGTSSAPIKLLNAPGQYPIIDFIDKNQYHQLQLKNKNGYRNAIGWITIEGFEIRNGYTGIKYWNLRDSVIRRNWIHHNISQGIQGNGGIRVVFDRNKINHNGNFSSCASGGLCNQSHGFYLHGQSYTITNNLFYDNVGYGIQQNGADTSVYSSTKHPGPEFAGAKNWLIANNTLAYQANRAGMVVWGSACDNTVIQNNIFYENGVKLPSWSVQGIVFTGASGSTGIVIRNNLAYASGSGATAFLGSGGSYTQSGNIINSLQPKFVNALSTLPSSPNFSLTSGSPAIDRGMTLSASKISYAGTPRPQLSSYDIGAYEYYGSSSQLAAPTSLQAAN